MFTRDSMLGLLLFIFVGTLLAGAGCQEKPVAIVNGGRITEKEFIVRMKETGGEGVLQEMIDRKIIEDAFVKAGLQLSAEEVTVELQKIQNRYPSPEVFNNELVARGLSLAELQDSIEYALKREKLATKDVQVTEEKLEAFYQQNKGRYDKPLRVKIKEIVAMGKQPAEEAVAALRKEGASFAAVANQYSVSVSRESGGQLREMPISQVQPLELQEPAATAEVGSIVGPIETERGWYVIQIDDRKAAEKSTLESVREEVTREFKGSEALRFDKLLEQLRQQAVVKIVDPEYQEMNKVYIGPQDLPDFGDEARKPQAPAQPATPAEQSEAPEEPQDN